MEKWHGKYAIVTGASSGLGEAIARKLAENGINVIALARRYERMEENIKNLGETKGKIYPHKCDISDLESIKETFKWIEDNFGEVNILINNAGTHADRHILDESEEATEEITRIINVNLTNLIHCTRKTISLMKKTEAPSIIINISSIFGHYIQFLNLNYNVYPSTKFGLRALNEVIRQELIFEGNLKIRTSCISPGVIKTDFAPEEIIEANPYLLTENVADAALYILSTPENVNVTDVIIKPVGEKF